MLYCVRVYSNLCVNHFANYSKKHIAVEDSGFYKVRKECSNLLFYKIFVKNCMKIKEFGPKAELSLAPPWIRHCMRHHIVDEHSVIGGNYFVTFNIVQIVTSFRLNYIYLIRQFVITIISLLSL